jgi:predicted N-acetyltransferase YhbS
MTLILRSGTPNDGKACGKICYEAFDSISKQHNFPSDFPDIESAEELMNFLLPQKSIESIVAEIDGKVVGSNFLWKLSPIGGVGPITVNPNIQNSSVGRNLMEDLLERARSQKLLGIRLCQAAYHNRSLSLYTKLGFITREPLSVIQGTLHCSKIPGHEVRLVTEADIKACNTLHFNLHGFYREEELRGAVAQGTATLIERSGRITGYTTSISFFGHTVGETNSDLKALINASTSFPGPGFILPTRNSELLVWCLENGLRIVMPMTLMSVGLYNKPAGAFLPSVVF